ncbi:BlaI/MecI/CopY family transcriptional regulator [Streptomyces violascens]|uniref:BlaI/MecI/CopY family transcriptional regulator n=1 Tax=Streptomyces violascens TaxID=67381 RepID=UPI0037A9940C
MSESSADRRSPGQLEADVMAALWAAGTPQTAGDIQHRLARPLARTTVATILARLYTKGAAARERSGRGYAYTPLQDSYGLAARRMHRELQGDSDRAIVLARFVDQLSADDELLLLSLLEGDAP